MAESDLPCSRSAILLAVMMLIRCKVGGGELFEAVGDGGIEDVEGVAVGETGVGLTGVGDEGVGAEEASEPLEKDLERSVPDESLEGSVVDAFLDGRRDEELECLELIDFLELLDFFEDEEEAEEEDSAEVDSIKGGLTSPGLKKSTNSSGNQPLFGPMTP